eukprot:2158053-Pyramimonas_sp.AAC.1
MLGLSGASLAPSPSVERCRQATTAKSMPKLLQGGWRMAHGNGSLGHLRLAPRHCKLLGAFGNPTYD